MKQQRTFSYAKYGYLFSIPFVLAFCIFNLYPTVYTAVLGFTDCKGLGNTEWNFLVEEPFKNFEQILKNPSFITSVKNTFKIWIMNFIPQITLALLLTAWFTSRRNVLKGQGFFKVVFYMPNIITAASVAILFNALFGYPMGPVNDLLMSTGLRSGPFSFVDSKTASQCIIAFIQFWQWYGYTMIILISGVLGINPEIYEAAEIDGANDIQMFFRVTIPNLKTILLYTLITSLIGGLTMYDIPKMFNDGKPANATLTATMFIRNQAFQGSYMYNRAAAASMLIFIVVAACSAMIFFLMRDKNERR
ncbi:MAG: sugar ABC transporter permease [Oscillospiraceae bacterium]|nr:sugar ABC transporter permease [Oscillospiraceae bacterium]